MQRIEHPNPARRSSRFVSAIKVGNTIYVAGQIGTDWDGKLVGENDIEAQSQQCFVNLEQLLKAAGADMRHVVKLVTYLTDLNDYAGYAKVKGRYFPENPPVGTAVVVQALLVPGARIEIEATAIV
jgi:reactive intermediate/imine deaminase